MGFGWSFFLSLGLVLFAPLAASEILDPVDMRSPYDQAFQKRFGAEFDALEKERAKVDRAREHLRQGTWTEEERYLLDRFVIGRLFSLDPNDQKRSCLGFSIRPDDYGIASECAYLSERPYAEKRVRLENLFKDAMAHEPNTTTAAVVAFYLLELYAQRNELGAARQAYKKAMQSCPLAARQQRMMLKSSIAGMYATPGQAKEILEESLQLYTEIIDEARSNNDSGRVQLFSYNRGVLQLFAFGDYQKAVVDFQQVLISNPIWIDAQGFLAFSLARLGKKEDALDILASFETETYRDDSRLEFMKCYINLTKWEAGREKNLESCVSLAADTQSDVMFHITRILSEKPLEAPFEVKLWRQFWRFYQNSLAPRMQEQARDSVDAIELEMTRAEVQIKQLELKNFQLLKIMLGITIAALLVNALVVLRLRSRNQKIEKLQKYIHKSILSRFLPPLIVEEIVQGKSRIESKPKMESVTVLFADMVNFTALSGTIGTEGISVVLNRFMETMTDIIYRHQGTIDKFIGDAVMVIFGAPMPLPEAEQIARAVACAREMQRGMEALNQEFVRDFQMTIAMRIGLNQGPAIVGTFGSEKRADFTAIGPTVNLASRIEGAAQPNEILIAPAVARYLPRDEVEERGTYRLKGINGDIALFAVVTPRRLANHPGPGESAHPLAGSVA